jgi:heme exporter protein CcmB
VTVGLAPAPLATRERARAAVPAIDAAGLAKRYGQRWALRDVDLLVAPGERVLVVGENGSGKSTLLRLLALATRPTRGTVRHGTPAALTFLPDQPALYNELTALENLRFANTMHGCSTDIAALDLVGLAHAADRPVRAFSRGMAQRLALAQVMSRSATLVLLDEPYTALDQNATTLVDDWLDELRAAGSTVVIATHQITARASDGARALTLHAGRVVSDRPAEASHCPALTPIVSHTDHDWRRAWAVAKKDLTIEGRASTSLGAVACFGALVLLILGLALGPDASHAAPGLGWVTVLLASVLALDRASQIERERGGWDGLRLAPGARWPICAGKAIATTILLLLIELLLLPCAIILYDLPLPPWFALPRLVTVAVLSTLGLAAAGTLYAALTANIRARHAMLPLLLFPIMIPVLLAAIKSTGLILTGDPLGELGAWTKLLVAADVVYLTTAILGFGVALDD